jgi:hypothetical protein
MRMSRSIVWLALSATAPVRADEPSDERMNRLEEELASTRASVEALAGRERLLSAELARTAQLQGRAAENEAARAARVQAVDALLRDAAEADLSLMAGDRPDTRLTRLEAGARALGQDAGARSGRLEYDRLTAARVSFSAARAALGDGDWLLARNHLAGGALELAEARNAAAGNPNRAAEAP